jgi:hypothetical protein
MKTKSEIRSQKVRKRRRRKPMSNTKQTKADAKATADEEAAEQAFLAKQAKKPEAKQQSAASGSEEPTARGEGTIQPREGEEFLPPPDPPVVDSPPTEPPAPDAVEDIPQKGAQPEELAVRELNLTPETPTAAPQPKEGEETE